MKTVRQKSCQEAIGVHVDVVLDESADEEVAVVVPILQKNKKNKKNKKKQKNEARKKKKKKNTNKARSVGAVVRAAPRAEGDLNRGGMRACGDSRRDLGVQWGVPNSAAAPNNAGEIDWHD